MSILLFPPNISYKKQLFCSHARSIKQLCEQAGITCKASGKWVARQVEIIPGAEPQVSAEPGDWGKVQITLPAKYSLKKRARLALAILAYRFHDLVAKQSIKDHDWARITPPPGRPRSKKALSNRERQRLFQARRLGDSKTEKNS